MKSDSQLKPVALSLQIISFLREQEIAVQLRRAFEERYLPEHLFYWLPSSVRAWVDLCRSTEYRNANRAIEALGRAGPDLARGLSEAQTLCGLGCGEGSKDRLLLEAFSREGHRLNYVAADMSQALLELAADQAGGLAKSVLGCKLDIFDDIHLDALIKLSRGQGEPILFSVLGNTLGAFDPRQFPGRLRPHLAGRDRFLFDGEIFDKSTLSGYDNPTNRRFAWGPLNGVGITEADGRLEFSTTSAGDGFFDVMKHFVAIRDFRVNVGGDVIEIRSGEKLRMSSSTKYANRQTLFGAVSDAGFRIDFQWGSKDGNFVLAYAAPT